MFNSLHNSDTFSALADPTRRTIIEMLATRGTLSASDISKNFNVSAPAISQHLKVLKAAELVVVEKKAQQRLYQVNPKKITELEQWIKDLTKQWSQRLDRLDILLEREKRKMGK
jgi:DNA-binding transcriptional ArsR family regulator